LIEVRDDLGEDSVVADEALARLPPFPIKDYLVELLRAGKLTSMGRQPDEMRYRDLSAADWSGLEVLERNGLQVAVSCETGGRANHLFIRLSQADVLREFPELTVKPNQLTAESSRPSLAEVLQDALRENPNLTQTEGEEIARRRGAIFVRKNLRALWKTFGGKTKPGPRGPRQNCAKPAA
jgi:hypothetical protein